MYNLKKEELVCGDLTFETTQYPAMEGLELMGELAQTIGPALGVLAAAEDDMQLEKLAPVLAAALQNLKPNQLSALALKLLRQTAVTGTFDGKVRRKDILSKDDFNTVFSGPNFKYLFKVLIHALKVNYSDFGLGSGSEAAPLPTE